MASRPPSLRQSLGLPTRVRVEGQQERPKKLSGLGVGDGRSSTAAAAAGNRRKTQVLSKGSRPSSVAVGQGSHKRSSVFGQGSHSQPKRDPRPLSDKSYQIASIKRLIAFLADKGYGKVTPKQLQHPSTKEFLHIFNFLVTMLDPSLEVNGMTIVEDVPKTLKLLGYPFTVSKNHMLNVGSPTSWPILLGALSWLVDGCNLPDRTTELTFPSETGFDDNESSAKEQEMRVEAYMYDVFLQYGYDSPEFQDLLQQKAEAKRHQMEELQQAVQKVLDENKELEQEVEELSQSSIPVLVARSEENKKTLVALKERVEGELPRAITAAEEEVTRLQRDNSDLEMQITASIEKTKELEDQIRQQPMSAKDARDLRQQISDAEHTLNKHRQIQHQNMNRIEELQIQHNRSVSHIDSACRETNEKLHRLAALLPDAASLPPLEYDTSRRADPEVLERLVTQVKDLREGVQCIHERVAVRVSELESKTISAEATQSTLHTELVRKQLENDNLQHHLDIEKAQLEQQKKKYEAEMKTGQAELHALQKQKMSLQHRMQEGPTKQHELETCRKEFEQEVMSMARDLEKKDQEYEQCVITLTTVVETAMKHKDQYTAKVEELIGEFGKLRRPSVPTQYLPSHTHEDS